MKKKIVTAMSCALLVLNSPVMASDKNKGKPSLKDSIAAKLSKSGGGKPSTSKPSNKPSKPSKPSSSKPSNKPSKPTVNKPNKPSGGMIGNHIGVTLNKPSKPSNKPSKPSASKPSKPSKPNKPSKPTSNTTVNHHHHHHYNTYYSPGYYGPGHFGPSYPGGYYGGGYYYQDYNTYDTSYDGYVYTSCAPNLVESNVEKTDKLVKSLLADERFQTQEQFVAIASEILTIKANDAKLAAYFSLVGVQTTEDIAYFVGAREDEYDRYESNLISTTSLDPALSELVVSKLIKSLKSNL